MEGLVIVKIFGVRVVGINVDSIDVVNGIKDFKAINPMSRALMSKIQEHYELDWDIVI